LQSSAACMSDIVKIVAKLDEYDFKILRLLLEKGGRLSMRAIARELNIDVKTVYRRITKLRELGLVQCNEVGTAKVPFLTGLGVEILRRLESSSGSR